MAGEKFHWHLKLSKYEITAGPAIGSDGTICYIMPENSDLYALNPDGSTKWVFDLSGYGGPSSSPAIARDGTIYVGADLLYAVDSGRHIEMDVSTAPTLPVRRRLRATAHSIFHPAVISMRSIPMAA